MARTYPKTARPFCDPPADYIGPLYYRVQANHSWSHPEWYWPDEAETQRWTQPGFKHPISRGFPREDLVGPDGALLPQWRRPMTYRWLPEKMPYEFHANIISERIHAIIEALAPGRHIFLPMDFTAPDGAVSRWYLRIFEQTALGDMPPALHPDLNALQTIRYTNGEIGFAKPPWAWCTDHDLPDYSHFGYLNESLVGGLHLFNASLLDNALVMSAELFERLRALGDNVLHRRDDYIPMGSAPHVLPRGGYRHEDDQPESETLMARWKRQLRAVRRA